MYSSLFRLHFSTHFLVGFLPPTAYSSWMDNAEEILDAALPMVAFDGWTMGTLEAAGRTLGLSSFEVGRAFPDGVTQALALFSARADTHMREALQREHDLPSLKIRERIAVAVMVRLRQNAAHREAVRRAVGFYTVPWNVPAGLTALYATVDTIWRLAGDTSTDYNFYSKRLLLAGVYQSTLPVWFADASPTLEDTEAFLRRRIENVMQIEKTKAAMRTKGEALREWMPKRWA